MYGFCSLASGSKGNSIYLGTRHSKLLIDAGISAKQIQKRLQEIDVSLSEINGICVTHEHKDHIQGLKVLAAKFKIPIIANSLTAKAIYETLNVKPYFKIFTTGESFELGDFEFTPFRVPHDTLDPVGFTVKINDLKVGFCTDFGFITNEVLENLKGCDYLYVEANHHVPMVHACNRSAYYKKRVLSKQGHLSNDDCLDLIKRVLNKKLKQIYLAHLSAECNSPKLLMKIMGKFLKDSGIKLSLAYQDRVSEAVLF